MIIHMDFPLLALGPVYFTLYIFKNASVKAVIAQRFPQGETNSSASVSLNEIEVFDLQL